MNDERIETLNQEVLQHTKKMSGMFGQIDFAIKKIDDDNRTIHATLQIPPAKEGERRVEVNVAEAIVRQLRSPFNQYKVSVEGS